MAPLLTILLDIPGCTLNTILGAAIAGVLMGIIGYLIGRSSASNPVTPFAGIDAALACAIVKNYGAPNSKDDTGNDLINPATGNPIPDARCVWFPLDSILSFTNEIAKTNLPADDTPLGIRLYYGRYPEAYTNRQYAGKHTVLMVPTYYDKVNNKNVDFDPWSHPDFSNLPAANGTSFIQSAFASRSADLNPMCLLNHGEIVPPPDPPMVVSDNDLAQQCGTTFLVLQ